MRRDHKPHWLYRLIALARRAYTARIIAPQFARVGRGLEVIGPHRLELYGDDIRIGQHGHIQTARGQISRLSTWQGGAISIGDHALLTPGVSIIAAEHIEIGDNVMLAGRVYISDADWHGEYNRLDTPAATRPIKLENNVWVGYGTIICKGVTIGKNSIIGAGSVVTKSIPANSIAGGNPAKPIRALDPKKRRTTRATLFADPVAYEKTMAYLHRLKYQGNGFFGWCRTKIWPRKAD